MLWNEKFEKSGYFSTYKRTAPIVEKCSCGHRIRGLRHEEGAAHKGTTPKNPRKSH